MIIFVSEGMHFVNRHIKNLGMAKGFPIMVFLP